MSEVSNSTLERESDEFQSYRELSKAAVISFALSILAFSALLFPTMIVLAFGGILFGVIGYRNIRRYPKELSGAYAALTGAVLSSLLAVGSIAFHTTIYLTEVPDGYQRISFAELQPSKKNPSLPISPTAMDLDGKRIFVKGYVHPGVKSQSQIKQFILVPDMGTCCFGGQPKLTDMIEVTLLDPHQIRYNQRKRKLGGVLKVNTIQKKVAGGLQGGFYQLEVDYLK